MREWHGVIAPQTPNAFGVNLERIHQEENFILRCKTEFLEGVRFVGICILTDFSNGTGGEGSWEWVE